MDQNISISHFLLFLNKFNIIPLAFSLIISLNLNQLSNSFIETIISPIVNAFFNNSNIKLKNRDVVILGIRFEYGLFLIHLIQFIFTLIILYFIYLFYTYASSKNIDLPHNTKPMIM
jgi:large-conductance mechanosensitive channel